MQVEVLLSLHAVPKGNVAAKYVRSHFHGCGNGKEMEGGGRSAEGSEQTTTSGGDGQGPDRVDGPQMEQPLRTMLQSEQEGEERPHCHRGCQHGAGRAQSKSRGTGALHRGLQEEQSAGQIPERCQRLASALLSGQPTTLYPAPAPATYTRGWGQSNPMTYVGPSSLQHVL